MEAFSRRVCDWHSSARRYSVRPGHPFQCSAMLITGAKAPEAFGAVNKQQTMKLQQTTATITGLRPLIMHSASMIDPENEFVKQIALFQRELKKAKKDDVVGRSAIRRKIEKSEWRGSVYWTEELGLYLPGANLTRAIVEGARKAKAGKIAEQGLVPIADMPIRTVAKSTKDIDELAIDPRFQFRSPVRIPPRTGSRIMKVRPVCPTGWSCEVAVEFDSSVFPLEDLREALETAGGLVGVGDWRPMFGRFSVEWSE